MKFSTQLATLVIASSIQAQQNNQNINDFINSALSNLNLNLPTDQVQSIMSFVNNKFGQNQTTGDPTTIISSGRNASTDANGNQAIATIKFNNNSATATGNFRNTTAIPTGNSAFATDSNSSNSTTLIKSSDNSSSIPMNGSVNITDSSSRSNSSSTAFNSTRASTSNGSQITLPVKHT
jgi:hypothetical protein